MRAAAALLLAALSLPAAAQAHGAGSREVEAPARVVQFHYADGEPMPFAEIRVFSPASPEVPFLAARADRNGRASFVPDADGPWRVEARDAEGHLARRVVEVASVTGAAQSAGERFPWLLWASLTLNLFLVIEAWHAWRARSRVSQAAPAGETSPGAA